MIIKRTATAARFDWISLELGWIEKKLCNGNYSHNKFNHTAMGFSRHWHVDGLWPDQRCIRYSKHDNDYEIEVGWLYLFWHIFKCRKIWKISEKYSWNIFELEYQQERFQIIGKFWAINISNSSWRESALLPRLWT